jgi:hypothetical protein
MIDLIEQEIATLRAFIDRHRGVGCYAEQCRVWGYYLEAYERILRLAPPPAASEEPGAGDYA